MCDCKNGSDSSCCKCKPKTEGQMELMRQADIMLSYQRKAMRTLSPDINFRMPDIRLMHSVAGICTEGGELMDVLKRHMFYGTGDQIDKVNIKEEYGDLLWYIALGCEYLGCTIADLMNANINKLARRYPDKFLAEAAINRDLEAEREQLEQDAGDVNPKALALARKIEVNAKRDADEWNDAIHVAIVAITALREVLYGRARTHNAAILQAIDRINELKTQLNELHFIPSLGVIEDQIERREEQTPAVVEGSTFAAVEDVQLGDPESLKKVEDQLARLKKLRAQRELDKAESKPPVNVMGDIVDGIATGESLSEVTAKIAEKLKAERRIQGEKLNIPDEVTPAQLLAIINDLKPHIDPAAKTVDGDSIMEQTEAIAAKLAREQQIQGKKLGMPIDTDGYWDGMDKPPVTDDDLNSHIYHTCESLQIDVQHLVQLMLNECKSMNIEPGDNVQRYMDLMNALYAFTEQEGAC